MKKIILFGLMLLLAGCKDLQHTEPIERAVIEPILDDERSDMEEIMVFDAEELEDIRSYLTQTEWQPNTEPKMARHEDVLLKLFIEVEKNMPERINDYRIWFNEDDSMTIISNVETEGFGKLKRKYGKPFKDLLQQKTVGSERVIDQHGKFENLELFHQFLKDVEENEQTALKVTRYTIEGAPIYWTVEYNGEHFNIEIDNRKDAWGSKNIENYQCGKLAQEATGLLTDYNFTSCEGGFEVNLLSVIKE